MADLKRGAAYTRSMPFPWPLELRERIEEIEKRYDHVAAQLNEYGYDPFGLDPRFGKQLATFMAILYDYYFRVETHGIERVPTGVCSSKRKPPASRVTPEARISASALHPKRRT